MIQPPAILFAHSHRESEGSRYEKVVRSACGWSKVLSPFMSF